MQPRRRPRPAMPAMPAISAMPAMPAISATPERALVPVAKARPAAARRYDPDDLEVVAELAHRYLFYGNAELARLLFEGLAAVAPDVAYYALALGLTYDHLGETEESHRWYARAAELDPLEGRADVNRGELYLEAGDRERAKRYFERGRQKAERSNDRALAVKAAAILDFLRSRP
jgi:Flp pilus assembly protein TadD